MTAYTGYRRLREQLERLPPLKRTIRAVAELKNIAIDDPERTTRRVDRFFYSRLDPYGFSRESEQLRFWRAEQMIDSASGGKPFQRVLEIGCAEGMFTERLAERSSSLLATDISVVALTRARRRCLVPHIEFLQWDLRTDALQDSYDLIVAVGVLEYLHGRAAFHRARSKLVQAITPGGYLLLGSTLQDDGIENSWVADWFLRGSRINWFFGQEPSLRVLASQTDQCALPFIHTLFQRVC